MSKVIIKKITLHYFKGVKNMEIKFNDGETTIAGPNGSGKSTIADAFNWLLWGKNMAGESDTKFLIKTVDENGEEIPHVDHEVEAELMVDGTELKIRRVLVPEYNKNDELKGNHTEYFWNDVPLKKIEYDAKIRGIMDETTFKFITSATAFLNLEWKKQREILMGMVGDINDDEIAEGNQDFVMLLDVLRKKNVTIDEYKQMLNSQLTKINERMNSIPARIDEVQRGMPDVPDFEKLYHEASELNEAIAAIDKENADLEQKFMKENEERLQTKAGINRMKEEQTRIVYEAEKKMREEIHAQNVRYDNAKMNKDHILEENRVAGLELQAKESALRKQIKDIQERGAAIADEMQSLREEWKKINAEQFQTGTSLICPLFGKQCNDQEACNRYDYDQEAAYGAFCKKKDERMAGITEKGKALKAKMEEINPQIENCEAQIEMLRKEYNETIVVNNGKVGMFDIQMEENPRRPLIVKVDPQSLPEWTALQEKIEKVENNEQLSATPYFQSKNNELKKAHTDRLAEIKVELAKNNQIETANKRVEELETELRTLGLEKAELEAQRTYATEFEVAKMNEVSSKVNGLFNVVTWQMFQKQVNGETIPACIALVGGVRWTDANTASRINAGIDVAASLARSNGSSAPMFIDNTESVKEVYNPGNQQRILLEFDKSSTQIIVR